MTNIEKLKFIIDKVLSTNPDRTITAGTTRERIHILSKSADFVVPEDLKKLYTWRNGIGHLVPFFSFNSIEDLTNQFLLFEKYETRVEGFTWNKDWLPILTLNGDVDILLNVATSELAALDMEMDTFLVIADHYSTYIDAMYDVFNSKEYCNRKDGSGIDFNPGVWEYLWSKYEIKPAWN